MLLSLVGTPMLLSLLVLLRAGLHGTGATIPEKSLQAGMDKSRACINGMHACSFVHQPPDLEVRTVVVDRMRLGKRCQC